MRNLLAIVGAAVVAFLVVGWYLGWYQVSNVNSHGQQSVNVSFNPNKIETDVKKGVDRGSEIVDNLREKTAQEQKAEQQASPASNFFAPTPSTDSTAGNANRTQPGTYKP